MNNSNMEISLAHGSGGKLMHALIEEMFRSKFRNDILDEDLDSALIGHFPEGGELAFTTDSYVIDPIFFPGGDIGKLAMCGTINDLSVVGARPAYVSCGFIIEEGLSFSVLDRITSSMAEVSEETGVKIVTGDIKVVGKGMCDKVFVNTSGIGERTAKVSLSRERIVPGDKIVINGPIGDHGIATLIGRGDFKFRAEIKSDCAPLWSMIEKLCSFHTKIFEKEGKSPIKFMRDPTRGGLATTLNEFVEGMDFGILIDEEAVPVREGVKAACEILGFDPLYVANEGKVVVVVGNDYTEDMTGIMREDKYGKGTRVIGEVVERPGGRVLMKTVIGGRRIVEMMVGEQLPRIC